MASTGFPLFEGSFLMAQSLSRPLLLCFLTLALLRRRALSAVICHLGARACLGLAWVHPYHTAVLVTKNSPSVWSPRMDDLPCCRFFLEPTQPLHRRFAALHAFFVEGLSPQAIGERFGLTYHTVRSWIRDFRVQCRCGQVPPFSPSRSGDGRAATPTPTPTRPRRKSQPWPTAA